MEENIEDRKLIVMSDASGSINNGLMGAVVYERVKYTTKKLGGS